MLAFEAAHSAVPGLALLARDARIEGGNGRPDAAARRDRRRGQDHQMVQIGRRRREAGRQPVRDRDRQGFDGGAVDRRRHAHRDPGAGRRCRAGRRRGRDHRRRGRRGGKRAPVATAAAPSAAAPPLPRSFPRKRESRAKHWVPAFAGTRRCASREVYTGRSIRSSRCARPSRNYGPATTYRRHRRHAAGAAARRRNSIDLSRVSGTGPRGRIVAADVEKAIAQAARGRAAPAERGASAEQVKALYQGVGFRGAAARRHAPAPSRRAWSRPSRPSRISISPPT